MHQILMLVTELVPNYTLLLYASNFDAGDKTCTKLYSPAIYVTLRSRPAEIKILISK